MLHMRAGDPARDLSIPAATMCSSNKGDLSQDDGRLDVGL